MKITDYGKWTRVSIWIEHPLGINENTTWYSGYHTEEYIRELFNLSPYEKIDIFYQNHQFVVARAEAYRVLNETT